MSDDGTEAERIPPGQLAPGLLPERIPSSDCVRGWGGTNSAPARLERGVASSNRTLGVEARCVATHFAASGIPKCPRTPLIPDQLSTAASPVDRSEADSQPPSPIYRARGSHASKKRRGKAGRMPEVPDAEGGRRGRERYEQIDKSARRLGGRARRRPAPGPQPLRQSPPFPRRVSSRTGVRAPTCDPRTLESVGLRSVKAQVKA